MSVRVCDVIIKQLLTPTTVEQFFSTRKSSDLTVTDFRVMPW